MTSFMSGETQYFYFRLTKTKFNNRNDRKKECDQWNPFDKAILKEINKKLHRKVILQHRESQRQKLKESPTTVKFQNSLLNSLNENNHFSYLSQQCQCQEPIENKLNNSLPAINFDSYGIAKRSNQIRQKSMSLMHSSVPLISKSTLIGIRHKVREVPDMNDNIEVTKLIKEKKNYSSPSRDKLSNRIKSIGTLESQKSATLRPLSLLRKKENTSQKERVRQGQSDTSPPPIVTKKMPTIEDPVNNNELKTIKLIKGKNINVIYKVVDCNYSILSKNNFRSSSQIVNKAESKRKMK